MFSKTQTQVPFFNPALLSCCAVIYGGRKILQQDYATLFKFMLEQTECW